MNACSIAFLLVAVLTVAGLPIGTVAAEECLSESCVEQCREERKLCEFNGGWLCDIHYDDCVLDCGAPLAGSVNFGSTPLGASKSWTTRVTNPESRFWFSHSGKRTLYASWSYPICDNMGNISRPQTGPFNLSYGQRWELIGGEGQNIAVDFSPKDPGTSKATLYLYWDNRGDFEWARVYNFTGVGELPVGLSSALPAILDLLLE